MQDTIHISALYHFAPVADNEALGAKLKSLLNYEGVKGTLIVAPEGINGTISGSEDAIENVLQFIRAQEGFAGLEEKRSYFDTHPFKRLKIKVRRHVLPFPKKVDPNAMKGEYVAGEEWNRIIADPNTIVIDTRNDYEFYLGSFTGAVNPKTRTFQEITAYTKDELAKHKDKKIAMFCTGGIRCEKYSSYLKEEGFEHVYHLKGGILQYLQDMPEENSLWEGDCFVFDRRVAVGHGVTPNPDIHECWGCGHPLTPKDREHPAYEYKVGCQYCDHKKQARYRDGWELEEEMR